ncbi:MAG: ATP-binding protein [Gemmatimonadota bacterium]|nr:ATP-binding protein [Gemmatimonadota bacterium]MDH5759405.1 ATP-binding protein [Gemmatimonadota bacterium]
MLVPFVAVLWGLDRIGVRESIDAQEEQIRSSLQTVLSVSHEAMLGWVSTQVGMARIEAARADFPRPDTAGSFSDSDRARAIRAIMGRNPAADTVFLALGPDEVNKEEYTRCRPVVPRGGRRVIVPPHGDFHRVVHIESDGGGVCRLVVRVPVTGEGGELNGSVTLVFDPHRAFSSLTMLGRIGATGETYAFDAGATLLSASRFVPELPPEFPGDGERGRLIPIRLEDVMGRAGDGAGRPLTLMAVSALRGEAGYDTEGYRDYRGVPVVGAWLWNSDLDLGLATEMDHSEAFAPLRVPHLAIHVLTATGILACVFLVLLIARLRGQRERVVSSERRFRRLFDTAPVGVSLFDGEGGLVSRNGAAVEMFDPAGSRWESLGAVLEHLRRVIPGATLSDDSAIRFEAELDRASGPGSDPVVLRTDVIAGGIRAGRSGARQENTIVLTQDVTAERAAERELRESLEEKKILLKEVHHRVKNNLQVISSLLYLQSRAVEDPRSVKMFDEARERVHAMAMFHETLYRGDSLAHVQAGQYVSGIAEGLMRSHVPLHVELVTECDPIDLHIDQAVPIGLILNELMTNSLKHGFPDDRRGEIRVEFARESPDSARLTVSDDGVGMPGEWDPERRDGLGTTLVSGLVRQLDATLSVSGGEGTRIDIRIPITD